MARRTDYVEIVYGEVTFRFYYDRADQTRLHIDAHHGVQPQTTIRVYFDADATVDFLPTKRCYETRTTSHILVWLEMEPKHVLVITCLPVEA